MSWSKNLRTASASLIARCAAGGSSAAALATALLGLSRALPPCVASNEFLRAAVRPERVMALVEAERGSDLALAGVFAVRLASPQSFETSDGVKSREPVRLRK